MFVDPACKERTWDKIENNSKQYVWAFNCSIGPALTHSYFDRSAFWTENLLELLENSKRILKPNGQFISGIGNSIDIETVDLDKFINVPELSSWNIRIIKSEDFTFNLVKPHGGVSIRL